MIHIWKSTDGQFYFTVVSKNGNTLATSETYSRKDNARNGAVALMCLLKNIHPNIEFIDHTSEKIKI